MTATLKIDKVGRIVLPKPVRERLQLVSGDRLDLEAGDDRITLRPVRGTAPLRKKQGVWVFRCGEPLPDATVRETLEQVRRERDEQCVGNELSRAQRVRSAAEDAAQGRAAQRNLAGSR